MANRFALIVAGGSGQRMGGAVPKQFIPLLGLPILMHTLNRFHGLDPTPTIFLVLPAAQRGAWDSLRQDYHFAVPHTVVSGGDTRYESVALGLNAIPGEGLVAIHDGVRPLVSAQVIERCYRLAQAQGNAIPALHPLESVRMGGPAGSQHVSRDGVWLVQTPQVFELSAIRAFYRGSPNADLTDDASLAQAHGMAIHITEGNRENIKITTPTDLLVAEALLRTTGA